MERDSTQEQYEEMTQTPVPKLVLRLAVPTTISMLVTSIYNMADTLFVSQLGTSVSDRSGICINGSNQCVWIHVWTWCGQQYQPEIRGA